MAENARLLERGRVGGRDGVGGRRRAESGADRDAEVGRAGGPAGGGGGGRGTARGLPNLSPSGLRRSLRHAHVNQGILSFRQIGSLQHWPSFCKSVQEGHCLC